MLLMDRYFLANHGIDRRHISPLDRLAYMADRGMGALEYRPVLEHGTGEDDIDLAQLYKESRRYTSDLPGDVIATVTEPVYDSATGEHVLIPQGARLLGRYNSQVNYGQSRVQVVWQRVILPDTSSFQLDNLVRTDAAGMPVSRMASTGTGIGSAPAPARP